MHSATAVGAAGAALVAVVGLVMVVRQVAGADADRRARLREVCAALVQYLLLFGFAAVAAAISAHGLVGFARVSMGLRGVWPFLLWAALDGAAGLCAVLLMRRAARGESAVAPRAVWGLVAASSGFNWAHAPRHPGAREAFALMPLIAAMLFEFSLRETRRTAQRSERRLTGLRWLHPVERIRVQLELAADEALTVQAATRSVRVRQAAWSLHRLRCSLGERGKRLIPGAVGRRSLRRAERRAQRALTRAGFTDAMVASEVLRLARILSQTTTLAGLHHAVHEAPEAEVASLVTRLQLNGSASAPGARTRQRASPAPAAALNGHAVRPGRLAADGFLIDTASEVVAKARTEGVRLSQAGLARELRAQGLSIANERLNWLAAQSGLNDEPPEQP